MLFACVREGKVDLRGVPLFPICEAYFAYVIANPNDNLDEAAAAMAALSYLLERKAWLLLPVDEPEPEAFEDPAELPDPTTHLYGPIIDLLRVHEDERSSLFFRPGDAGPDPYELPYELSDVSTLDLARALQRVLGRAKPEAPEPLNKPRKSLAEQMKHVLAALPSEWSSLDVMIEPDATRSEIVFWFLALLELIRLGQAAVRLYDGDVQFCRATR